MAFAKFEKIFEAAFGGQQRAFSSTHAGFGMKADDGIAMTEQTRTMHLSQQYHAAPELWQDSPTWTAADLNSLACDLFESSILSPRVAAMSYDADVPEFAVLMLESVHCQYPPLCNAALELLVRHYSQR